MIFITLEHDSSQFDKMKTITLWMKFRKQFEL